MQINYGTVAISDGGRESPSNLSYRITRQVEVVPLTRSDSPSIFTRNNRFYEISFSVAYVKADHREASEFAITLEDSLPAQGTLELIPVGGGGVVQVIQYENATLTGYNAVVPGSTVLASFSFVATNRLVTPP
jgi:hypothetical protein